jgi:hypothetical protein
MSSQSNNKVFNRLKKNYSRKYYDNLQKSTFLRPLDLNNKKLNYFLNSKKKELIFNAVDLYNNINYLNKYNLFIYGYIKDGNFIWIKEFNKYFYEKFKKKLNINILNYFFNKSIISLKNNKLDYVIPFLIFSLVPEYNMVEYKNIDNGNTIFGSYSIIYYKYFIKLKNNIKIYVIFYIFYNFFIYINYFIVYFL